MNIEWGYKVQEAKEKQQQMEHKLNVAETRLKAAQSKELEGRVERDRWTKSFSQEVESRRRKMDELQVLYSEAKRDEEPYDQWWHAKRVEWKNKGWDDSTEEGERLIDLERASAEYQTELKKWKELQKQSSEADTAHLHAQRELKFAEEMLETARKEDLAPIVEQAALMKRTQKEVRFAEFRVEEEKESWRGLDLKWGVLDNLYTIPKLKEKMKRLKVLLNWIEQQRQKLIGENAKAEQESGPRRSKRVSNGVHTATCVIKASDVHRTGKTRARSQKPSKAKSILDLVDPSKVTKASKQNRKGRRRTSVSDDISQAKEKTSVDFKTAEPNTTEPKGDAADPIKDGIHACLCSVHSSRVSKPTSKKPTGRRKDLARLSPARNRHRRTVADESHTRLDAGH